MLYTIEKLDKNSKFIKVSLSLQLDTDEEVFIFPNWRPGRYELGNFIKNVKHLKFRQEANERLAIKQLDKNSWSLSQIDTQQPVIIEYLYYANELNAGSTWVDTKQLYVNPVNCCIYPKSLQDQPLSLKLVIPKSYKVAGALYETEGLYNFENIHELMDTPFIASANVEELSFTMEGVTFHLWFQGEFKLDEKRILRDVKKYTRLQIEQFGSFPVEDYHYLYHILPYKHYHGVEHEKSTVITLGPSYELLGKLYVEFLGVSSHELYHTWNVKYIRPKEWFPYNYKAENYSELGYIAEGVTTYMGDLTLLQSNTLDWKWFDEQLSIWLNRHFDNFGRFNQSVATSGFNTWVDGYVQGTPGRKVSIYNEGALLAFALDVLIIHHTERKSSLHTLMQNLYTAAKDDTSKRSITKEDYQGKAEELCGVSLDWFFTDYVYGKESFEGLFLEILPLIGLELEKTERKSITEGKLGFKHSKVSSQVLATYPGSDAELAGLQVGDKVVAINSIKVNGDLEEWLNYFDIDNLNLTVERNNELLEMHLPVSKKVYYSDYKLTPHHITPSQDAKNKFKTWSCQKYTHVYKN